MANNSPKRIEELVEALIAAGRIEDVLEIVADKADIDTKALKTEDDISKAIRAARTDQIAAISAQLNTLATNQGVDFSNSDTEKTGEAEVAGSSDDVEGDKAGEKVEEAAPAEGGNGIDPAAAASAAATSAGVNATSPEETSEATPSAKTQPTQREFTGTLGFVDRTVSKQYLQGSSIWSKPAEFFSWVDRAYVENFEVNDTKDKVIRTGVRGGFRALGFITAPFSLAADASKAIQTVSSAVVKAIGAETFFTQSKFGKTLSAAGKIAADLAGAAVVAAGVTAAVATGPVGVMGLKGLMFARGALGATRQGFKMAKEGVGDLEELVTTAIGIGGGMLVVGNTGFNTVDLAHGLSETYMDNVVNPMISFASESASYVHDLVTPVPDLIDPNPFDDIEEIVLGDNADTDSATDSSSSDNTDTDSAAASDADTGAEADQTPSFVDHVTGFIPGELDDSLVENLGSALNQITGDAEAQSPEDAMVEMDTALADINAVTQAINSVVPGEVAVKMIGNDQTYSLFQQPGGPEIAVEYDGDTQKMWISLDPVSDDRFDYYVEVDADGNIVAIENTDDGNRLSLNGELREEGFEDRHLRGQGNDIRDTILGYELVGNMSEDFVATTEEARVEALSRLITDIQITPDTIVNGTPQGDIMEAAEIDPISSTPSSAPDSATSAANTSGVPVTPTAPPPVAPDLAGGPTAPDSAAPAAPDSAAPAAASPDTTTPDSTDASTTGNASDAQTGLQTVSAEQQNVLNDQFLDSDETSLDWDKIRYDADSGEYIVLDDQGEPAARLIRVSDVPEAGFQSYLQSQGLQPDEFVVASLEGDTTPSSAALAAERVGLLEQTSSGEKNDIYYYTSHESDDFRSEDCYKNNGLILHNLSGDWDCGDREAPAPSGGAEPAPQPELQPEPTPEPQPEIVDKPEPTPEPAPVVNLDDDCPDTSCGLQTDGPLRPIEGDGPFGLGEGWSLQNVVPEEPDHSVDNGNRADYINIEHPDVEVKVVESIEAPQSISALVTGDMPFETMFETIQNASTETYPQVNLESDSANEINQEFNQNRPDDSDTAQEDQLFRRTEHIALTSTDVETGEVTTERVRVEVYQDVTGAKTIIVIDDRMAVATDAHIDIHEWTDEQLVQAVKDEINVTTYESTLIESDRLIRNGHFNNGESVLESDVTDQQMDALNNPTGGAYVDTGYTYPNDGDPRFSPDGDLVGDPDKMSLVRVVDPQGVAYLATTYEDVSSGDAAQDQADLERLASLLERVRLGEDVQDLINGDANEANWLARTSVLFLLTQLGSEQFAEFAVREGLVVLSPDGTPLLNENAICSPEWLAATQDHGVQTPAEVMNRYDGLSGGEELFYTFAAMAQHYFTYQSLVGGSETVTTKTAIDSPPTPWLVTGGGGAQVVTNVQQVYSGLTATQASLATAAAAGGIGVASTDTDGALNIDERGELTGERGIDESVVEEDDDLVIVPTKPTVESAETQAKPQPSTGEPLRLVPEDEDLHEPANDAKAEEPNDDPFSGIY